MINKRKIRQKSILICEHFASDFLLLSSTLKSGCCGQLWPKLGVWHLVIREQVPEVLVSSDCQWHLKRLSSNLNMKEWCVSELCSRITELCCCCCYNRALLESLTPDGILTLRQNRNRSQDWEPCISVLEHFLFLKEFDLTPGASH